MSYQFEAGKDVIIGAVVEKVKQKMQGEQALLCAEFVRQFFSRTALDDLNEWSIDDLYGAAVNFWSLIQNRAPDEVKIRIYNPDFERHGWQTTHTVVEIVCKAMPFLVDSVRMVVNRMGLSSHLIIHMGSLSLVRGADHEVTAVLPKQSKKISGAEADEPIFMEIDRQTDPEVLEDLRRQFVRVLADNQAVVEDWLPMQNQVEAIVKELDQAPESVDRGELEETKSFLRWIVDHHFTLLGVRDYELLKQGKETLLQAIPQTGLGVLRSTLSTPNARNINAMTPEARELTLSSHTLVMSKTNTLASVHRDAHTDYIGVKRFDKAGNVIGERRIIGLYTSAAYNTNPKHIPFLRHKVARVMHNSTLDPKGHAAKVLLNILETLPRDDLIQASEDELLEISMGIFYMQERRRIRMFARTDVYRRFISCLVFVPKDLFNTELREEMQAVLKQYFNAKDITFSTRLSESILARIHFIIRIDPNERVEYDFKAVENKLIEVGRSWTDDLQQYLIEALGEEQGNGLYATYKSAFPAVYKTNFSPRVAVLDVKHIEQLSEKNALEMNFYRPISESGDKCRLKIYQHDNTIPLSDVLPIIENLGMRAISERPYRLKFGDGKSTWVNDFAMQCRQGKLEDFDNLRELFQTAFTKVWFGEAENDGFNQLILRAGLDWRQVAMLRMYTRYFKQIRFTFSQEYIISALNNNAPITRKLVQLFEWHFDPKKAQKERVQQTKAIKAEILNDLEAVENLDEDKIIRQFVHAIAATLRTNYYQVGEDGLPLHYISMKFNSQAVPGMPQPYPMFEIFVYSPRFEGVHLRGGKVARGGLRWSDRREDFRTEVLGLLKAQQVKNAVIVPGGAKGGFVAKQIPANASREEIMAEGIACYQQFIRGLLDLTDNLKQGKVCKPENLVCYDEDDAYLVVAADKGTATFSDIANAISADYEFWLGDAFASGGSVGYDHKKMGITARGAWESVKRHFYNLGVDINTTDFTVVGIGDMAGDVFGNGMLLSNHIQLVAAFNHAHIFIDPHPDAQISFNERQRLFQLPRSSWADYDKTLISKGGGVFSRNAKSIAVSKEMQQVFGIQATEVEPNELIKCVLGASFDLLWSAGIGTFVKAESESHLEVGDRTNDAIRINATELHCKVVGEGGNLGFTQLARVEYALNGGRIYTDFIDNSAGVSSSDKEVNIKILLNSIQAAGDLTYKQRNVLLSEMTDEVAHLVLRENYLQTRAISMISAQTGRTLELHSRYIQALESTGQLNRALEFLPDEKTVLDRKLNGQGLVAPDIAVLFCYSKILLKEAILESDVPEDPFLNASLVEYFPKPLQKLFSQQMCSHPLKREIVATSLSNTLVNEVGFTFVYRLQDETGASAPAVVRAYMVARKILDMDKVWQAIDALDKQIDAADQIAIMMNYMRLLRRITRWFLRMQRTRLDMTEAVNLYAPGVQKLKNAMPAIFCQYNRARYEESLEKYQAMGIASDVAHEFTITPGLFAAMDILQAAHEFKADIITVAEAYFALGECLDLAWIRTQVIVHPTDNHWEALSREALRDDLDWQQRQLTMGILKYAGKKKNFTQKFESWSQEHTPLIARWKDMLGKLRSSTPLSYTMFFAAVRELMALSQTTIQGGQG